MRLFLFFTTIFSCFFLVSGQTYTGVPDDNFEQYLINEGYDTTLDNYVLTSNINDIIFIDISGQDINDLSGIEDFSALQYLTCSDNELTEIDFCYNFELLFLDCSNNPLNTLNLSHAPLLQTLVCQGSVIEELDLSQNYNLIELNIINSPIECVQVGGLYSGPSSFLNANLTMDPNGEDYFAEDCGYFSWQCSGPLFTGWVYYDEDADGIKDEDEIYLSDQIIIKDSDTDFVTASSSSEDLGRFAFYLTDGQYEVSVVPDDGWITTNTDPLAVTVIDFIPDVTDVVLGVHPIVLGHNDMSVDLTAGIQTCASVNMFYIHYENLGVISNNIEISLYLDSGLQSYSSADVAPSSIIENEVVWNINDVDVGEEGVITVAYVSSSTTTSTLASVVLTSPDVLGVMSDINMENNYDQISDEILCSLDPNDKLVSPAFGDENYVEFEDTLEYTLRFQNVGNYFAFNIRIEDTISNFLDMTTFKFIESSHDVYYEFGNDRSLVFYFDDIMLIDSISDPLGSQGFVKFAIAPKENIDEFTVVENTGFIYFDYNEAVVTNTTMSTFVSEITFGCWDGDACNFNGSALIEDNSSCDYALEFYDCQGNCISDIDLDAVCDELDNCPAHYNPDQIDTDSDGVGDECDPGSVGLDAYIDQNVLTNQVDILGKKTLNMLNSNQFLIYLYEDGSIKKNFIIKH